MKEATDSPGRRNRIRFIEIATVCAVLGIIASLAIPSFLQMQARARVDRLLESARSCRQELSGLLSYLPAKGLAESRAEAEAGIEALDARDVLEEYARIYNGRFKGTQGSAAGTLVVVETTGTQPAFCQRDGRIHIIPFADPSTDGFGAKVVVTDENKIAGPNRDGILAVFDVEPRPE